jgi:hypothetical protein
MDIISQWIQDGPKIQELANEKIKECVNLVNNIPEGINKDFMKARLENVEDLLLKFNNENVPFDFKRVLCIAGMLDMIVSDIERCSALEKVFTTIDQPFVIASSPAPLNYQELVELLRVARNELATATKLDSQEHDEISSSIEMRFRATEQILMNAEVLANRLLVRSTPTELDLLRQIVLAAASMAHDDKREAVEIARLRGNLIPSGV